VLSSAIRALGYRFYISEVPEGGSLKRFCINYPLSMSYKCRISPPKKNIISMLFLAWSCLKVEEISKRRCWENHLHPFKLSVPVGTARGSRKALKPQQNSTSGQKRQPGSLAVPSLVLGSACEWAHRCHSSLQQCAAEGGQCHCKTISLGTTICPADRKEFVLLCNHAAHPKRCA